MGEEICTYCKDDEKIINENEGNLSSSIPSKIQKNNYNYQLTAKLLNNYNNKNKNNINNENDGILYDNPLCNISLNESMNLGNCYIGTNNKNNKLKAYKPDMSLKSLMTKNKLTLDSSNALNSINKFNDSPINKRINLTSKNKNTKIINYNDYFENKIKIKKNNNTPKNIYISNNNSDKNINNDIQKFNNIFYYNSKYSNVKNDNYNYSNNIVKINNDLNNKNNDLNYSINNKNEDLNYFNENEKNVKINNEKLSDSNNYYNHNNIIYSNNDTKEKNYIDNIYKKESNKIFTINKEGAIIEKLKSLYLKYNAKILYKLLYKISKKLNQNNIKIYQYKMTNQEFIQNITNFNFIEYDVNLFPSNNYIYIGEKINNKKNGYGLEVFEDSNSYYFGKFINDRRIEICKYVINNENQKYHYLGEVNDIHARGYGIYINDETGVKYEGEWKNSMKNGIGIEIYKNNFYQGNFVNGKRNGIGEYFWERNVFYSGEWKNNLMDGIGIYNFNDYSIYEGNWKNNKMNGFGILNNNNNKIYVGFFKNDCKNGFGVMTWSKDKKAFIGFWENNRQNGFGKTFYHDKYIFGFWRDGKIVKKIDDKEELEIIFKNINQYFFSFLQLETIEEINQIIKEYFLLN